MFTFLSIEDIGISCLTSSPFIKPMSLMNLVFFISTFFKLILALTISLSLSSLSSLSFFSANASSKEEDTYNMLRANVSAIKIYRNLL